ncbi:unnamed protein product [Boreogadus saida]
MDLRRATGQEADRFIRAISPGVSGIPDCIAAAAAVMATVAAMMGSRWCQAPPLSRWDRCVQADGWCSLLELLLAGHRRRAGLQGTPIVFLHRARID